MATAKLNDRQNIYVVDMLGCEYMLVGTGWVRDEFAIVTVYDGNKAIATFSSPALCGFAELVGIVGSAEAQEE